MILSPLVGFTLGYLLMVAILWTFRRPTRTGSTAASGWRQTVSAAAMALGHGLQDAQKTMGVIVLALVVGGYRADDDVPLWVICWRPARSRWAPTPAAGGSCARSAGASSTSTHRAGSPPRRPRRRCSTRRRSSSRRRSRRPRPSRRRSWASAPPSASSAVRWGVAGNILVAWVLTIPMAALMAALVYFVVHPLLERLTVPSVVVIRRRARGRSAEAAGDVVLGALVRRVGEDLRGQVELDQTAGAIADGLVGLER